MGNCCPCGKSSQSTAHVYVPVPTREEGNRNVEIQQTSKSQQNVLHQAGQAPNPPSISNTTNAVENSGSSNNLKPVELNLYSNVFSGAEVLQKFAGSMSYTTK